MSDGAWYFYLFWLPKYLFEARAFDLKQAASVGWIPYAAAGIGSLCGGYLSSRLLARNFSVNAAATCSATDSRPATALATASAVVVAQLATGATDTDIAAIVI